MPGYCNDINLNYEYYYLAVAAVRFENEEKEVEAFVSFLKDHYPEEYKTWNPDEYKMGTVTEILNKIKNAIIIRSDAEIADAVLSMCRCSCDGVQVSLDK
jgi:hypothetical protein